MGYLSSARASRMAKRPRRDTQKAKVYAAEQFLWGTSVGTTLAEVQAYVDKLVDYAWFRRRWGSRRIRVEARRGLGGQAHLGGTIEVGFNATGAHGHAPGAQVNVVLHEIAHQVTTSAADGNWHGPEFARAMLEIVRYALGEAQVQQLREEYRKHKVKVGSPTVLRALEQTPDPRPTPRTWRFEANFPTGVETIAIEALTLKHALERIIRNYTLTDTTELKIWKSRATSTRVAASGKGKVRP
jgi:putative metallohydrolase (TIGR04338 family)